MALAPSSRRRRLQPEPHVQLHGALPAGPLNLAVFDGQNGQPVPAWYSDNNGSLNYTITYLGL
jgi:hypothetical protein